MVKESLCERRKNMGSETKKITGWDLSLKPCPGEILIDCFEKRAGRFCNLFARAREAQRKAYEEIEKNYISEAPPVELEIFEESKVFLPLDEEIIALIDRMKTADRKGEFSLKLTSFFFSMSFVLLIMGIIFFHYQLPFLCNLMIISPAALTSLLCIACYANVHRKLNQYLAEVNQREKETRDFYKTLEVSELMEEIESKKTGLPSKFFNKNGKLEDE